MTRIAAAALVAIAAVAHAEPTAAPTATYVVQPGDTCLGIALHQLGDRTAVRRIHLLNPQLGPLPHVLRPGSVLTLPPPATPSGPDATLSRARGEVKVRRPTSPSWDAATRGMDLYRAWRVGASVRASAELTFHDDARLRMREQTIVIIYGPERDRAVVLAASATLEDGTLETRLGELGGRQVQIATPGAEARLGAGRAVVTVDRRGDSIVANHDGGAVLLRGADQTRRRKTRAVRVAAGMGSKVHPGRAPEAPRPLPPPPSWGGAPPAGGEVTLAWAAVATAARYRVAIEDDAGDEVAALAVAAPATSTVVRDLPPGRYQARVAATDGDGFESAPSAPLRFELVAIAAAPPPPEPPVLAPAVAAMAPVEVVASPPILPPPPPAAVGFELGVFVGGHAFLGGDLATGLGHPTADADRVASGPSLGVRAGVVPDPHLVVEAEAALIPTGSAAAPGTALVASYRAHLGLLTRGDRTRARFLIGGGAHALVAAPAGSRRDTAPFLDWGLALTHRLGRRLALRLDLRDELGAGQSGVSHGLDLTFGVATIVR